MGGATPPPPKPPIIEGADGAGRKPLKGKNSDSVEEDYLIKKAARELAPYLIFSLKVIIIISLIAILVWFYHILLPTWLQWLTTGQISDLQNLLLETKEVLLGGTMTATVIAFTRKG